MRTVVAFALGASLAASLGGVRSAPPAREVVSLRIGDTLSPRYAVRTDTVLGVGPGVVVAKKCGASKVFLRLWRGNTAISNDTVDVTVTGCSTVTSPPGLPLETANDVVALWVRDAGGLLTPWPSGSPGLVRPVNTPSFCVYLTRRNPSGQYITGRPVTLAINDPEVASISASAVCPDTTINPALLP